MLRSAPLDRLKDLADPGCGLSSAAAASRQAAFGRNDIVVAAPNGWRELARDTVRDPMLWFLLFTATLFAALGQTGEAATLFVAIVPLVAMDAYLHWRTQASTAGLSGRLAAVATALRDAERRRLPAADLVPGDLVFVAAGEAFPADGVLVETRDAKCDESALSGEAYPMHKSALAGFPAGEADAAIDTRHWGFAGTRLLTGSASLRVAFTGGETIYGEIVRSARAGRHARTPLQQAVAHLVGVLLTGAVVVCLLLAAIRLQQGHGVLDALLSAVTLAVAVLPEEFPVVLTFFLGVGVYRLARRQALVRRAVAVENIGRITCICSDKTGTLTAGTLALAHVYPAVEGDDRELLRIAALASRRETGDPMDLAILASAGATAPGETLATFPFTEDRRRETCILREGPGKLLAATKGAPETVLAMATLDADARGEWQRRVDQLAGTGHKVIACASRRLDDAGWAGGEPDRGLAFAGLLAFEDPVRDGAADAVRAARAAGIKVIMVTGDHPVTARAVGADIGLGDGTPEVVSGPDFERRLASEGAGFLAGIDVIARAAPGQKLALVRSLQQAGEIVAVTGDGVNDVPALQAADVGIAMGERGTQSAREVAAIVLLDDNFRTIVRAIAEGRQLFANLQLSFAYLLMIHMPLVLTAALVPAAGYPLLYLPAHIVWLELIIHPTALLVFQELLTRQRLDPVEPRSAVRFFSRRQWLVVALVGALIALVVMLGYERSLGAGRDVEHARAMALVALIVASAVLAAALSRLRTWTAGIVVIASLGSAIACVQIAPLAALLHLAPLHVDDWAAAVLGGLGAALPTLGFRVAGRGRKSRSRAAA
jgi:Ca2+-transporting ATPase